MAGTQAKSAIGKWQLAKSKAKKQQSTLSSQHSVKQKTRKSKTKTKTPQTHNALTPRAQRNLKAMEAPSRAVRFPQAKGRVVEEVEFYSGSDYNCLSFKFQDKTNLCFEIETGFTLLADFSRWKSGEQQILRDWPPLAIR